MILTRDKSFYKTYFSLLFYIAFQNLLSFGVSLLDNVMLSNYSMTALNGASIANQIQFLLQMIVTSAGEGVVVLAAQYWGAKKTKPIYDAFSIGNIVALAFGLLFFVLIGIMPRGILSLLVDDEAIIFEGAAYLSIIKYTYPVYCLSTVMLATQRSVENARVGFIAMFVSMIVNAFFNYGMIYGKLGFTEMGIRGAAYATLISRCVELVIAYVYAYKFDKKLSIRPCHFLSYNKALWKDYAKYATPVILGGASWGLAMFIQTSIIGHMNSDAIAANTLAANLFSVISVFAYGGGNSAGVITGKIVGAGDTGKLKEYVRTMQVLFLLTGLVTGGLIFALRSPVIALFGLETEGARAYARQFIAVLSITSIGSAYQAPCLTGIVRGGGRTNFVFYNDLIFQWGIVILFSLLAAYVWHLAPVWVFFILKSDQLLKCGVAVVEVNSYKWVRKLTNKAAE